MAQELYFCARGLSDKRGWKTDSRKAAGLTHEGILLRVGNSLQPMDNFFKPKDRALGKKILHKIMSYCA
jgi:hypothetical protein